MTVAFRLTPAIILGLNDGYIAEGHTGANHLAIQIGSAFQLTDTIALEAMIAQTFEINSNAAAFADDESLIDLFYGRIALSVSF